MTCDTPNAQLDYQDEPEVRLLSHIGGDDSVVKAMLVSTLGAESIEADATYGRINYLMKNRHGTPFEHNSFTFYIKAPIAVFREFQRHRIGMSYNEMSGRYKELEPTFYLPNPDRPLVQEGKPGAYTFVAGTPAQYRLALNELDRAYQAGWRSYQVMLMNGIAKEVARMALPVGIYSQMYVTCNARSLMSFLSLRTTGGQFPSYPQYEIEQVAKLMEIELEASMPLTHKSFVDNGRVSP